MYKQFAEFIVRVTDLAEAEGRLLRCAMRQLGLGIGLMAVSAVLVLVAAIFLLAGLWLGLGQSVGPAWASVITGVLALVLAVAGLLTALRITK